jgi:DNA mismatch repair protein MutS2
MLLPDTTSKPRPPVVNISTETAIAETKAPVPDLLSLEPQLRIDAHGMRQTLAFAFAAGVAVDTFDHAMAEMRLPPSAWDRSHYSRDLFLRDFVERCLPVRAGGRAYEPCVAYLLRVVAEPPRDPEVAELRRDVLRELVAKPEMVADMERVYVQIVQMRALIAAGRYISPYLRRLEILRSLHAIFTALGESFDGATSALARVRQFGEAVVEGPAYRRLDALLDHEAHLGTIDLRVRVGSDGELRTFQVVSVRENRANPFYSSAIGRFISRLLLFLRGYRMSGGEVAERLFDDVFTALEGSTIALFQLLGDMEFYLAALGFRDMAVSKGLSVCFPDPDGGEDGGMELKRLYNPLLFDGKTTPIPCDIRSAQGGTVVFVTGPNSGGKTRLLQAIAFAQMLGEAGMFVPARKARMPRVSGLFVSLVEEARSDQPEGQLGMELLRIRKMFDQLDVGSLVLLDELCSGTNPSEGEEIARLVISLLPELGAKVFVTTHLLSFAARIEEEMPIAGLEFLQVELDEYERPTYGFLPGVARTSLAQKTAARLGVTREELSELISKKRRASAVRRRSGDEAD